MVEYEIKRENSWFGESGFGIYKNGERIDWSLAGLQTIISNLKRIILASSKDGGKIILAETWWEERNIFVEPCPTNHARVVDDFMGGDVCLDCKAVW